MKREIKKVKVDVRGKSYEFKFKKLPEKKIEESKRTETTFCEKYCFLDGLCGETLLSDPCKPDNKMYSFNDFCLCMGDTSRNEEDIINDNSLDGFMPVMNFSTLSYVKDINPEFINEIKARNIIEKLKLFTFKIFKK